MQDKEQKTQIVNKFAKHEKDVGSSEVQVALLTSRINQLTEHFRAHAKDFAGRRGLLSLVSKRRGLLDYLKRKNEARYTEVIRALDIRR